MAANGYHPPRPAGPLDAPGPAEPAASQLLAVFRTLRRRAWLIAGITAAAAIAALALSLNAPKQYDATAKLLVEQDDALDRVDGGGSSNVDPERRINNVTELVRLETLVDRQRRKLQMPASTQDLRSRLSTNVEPTSDVVTVTFRDRNRERAAEFVNGLVRAFVAFRRESARSNLDEATRLARQRLARLTPAERDGPLGRELQSRVNEFETAAALQTGGVDVIRLAPVPTVPSEPKPKRSAAIGFFLGLTFAILAAFLLEFADRRLRDEADFEEAFMLPVLATVPRPRGRARGGLALEDPGQREAYTALATSLRFSRFGEHLKVAMVTSPAGNEGKTSVTLGLSRALANLGLQVIAIEADLRRPMFRSYLGLSPRPGLTSVLRGTRQLRSELVTVDAARLRGAEDGAEATFWVLPAGSLPTNPTRALASEAMVELLEEARGLADVVLIDTAPVGVVTDALTLIEHVDQTVVVARHRKTTRDHVWRTLRALENFGIAGADLLGLVITDAPPRRGGDASYYDASPAVPGNESLDTLPVNGRARAGSASLARSSHSGNGSASR
jgi:capsular exopolysaccharide synthesis family protein